MKIFKIYNFDLINVVPQKTHGGSMRYVVGRKNKHKINDRVHEEIIKEKNRKLDDIISCLEFIKNCLSSCLLNVSISVKYSSTAFGTTSE